MCRSAITLIKCTSEWLRLERQSALWIAAKLSGALGWVLCQSSPTATNLASMQAALMLRSKSRERRKQRLKRGIKHDLPSNIATKLIAPFPRYPPASWVCLMFILMMCVVACMDGSYDRIIIDLQSKDRVQIYWRKLTHTIGDLRKPLKIMCVCTRALSLLSI